MEYGLIPTINQYAENNELLVQQIQPSNEIAKLNNENESKRMIEDSFLNKVTDSSDLSKTSKSKEVSASEISQYQEVVLTNLNFGFNDSSKDFYVKAIRGDSENQYPTDEMMRLKAYYIAQAKSASE